MMIPGLSYAIVNEGKIVHHRVFGWANQAEKTPVTEETLFEGASTSKPVFASMVMMLVEDGKMDLDRPLYSYLKPEDRINYSFDPRFEQITARMALAHMTGFPNWRGQGELTIAFDPGTNFAYSGEGYQFLVKAVESILQTDHKGLENFYQERIALPLNMKHSKFVQDDYNRQHKAFPHFRGIVGEKENWEADEFNAASALHTEAQEYASWLIALMNDQLISPEQKQIMFSDQIVAADAPSLKSNENAEAWTLGFARYQNSGHRVLGHEGNNDGFNALVLFDENKKWALIQFNNAHEVYDFGYELFGYLHSDHP